MPFRITNYLDDFLFIAESEEKCNFMVRKFLSLCESIGCPVAMDKTEWATSNIVFLGVGLDGIGHRLMVPKEKQIKALNAVMYMVEKKKATIKEIQRLTGILNFLNKIIVPGRAFTRGLYSKLKTSNNEGKKLKPYHHINLSQMFKSDCRVWLEFLINAKNHTLCRPFLDWSMVSTSTQLDFYTDSSGGKNLGFGCVFGKFYTWNRWEEGFISRYEPSIQFLELYALCVGIFTWEKKPAKHEYKNFL